MKAHSHGIPENTSGSTSLDPGHIHAISYANGSGGANTRASESTTDS